jgi:glycosyltransferase involved in cell wall biosynthesis
MADPAFVIIEACDFDSHPAGGTLTFAKQMLTAFDNVAAAGMTTRLDDPLGRWFVKQLHGREVPYFAFQRVEPRTDRPLIPARLTCWRHFIKHRTALIRGSPSRRAFTRSPEIMLALNRPPWESICYCFAGISNSVGISRYPLLRVLGGVYERTLFKKLKRSADVVLAAASAGAIADACARTGGMLKPDQISFFPTRFNDKVFFPRDRKECRRAIGLPENGLCFAVCGRISWVKGWRLVLDAYRGVCANRPDSCLVFIGDGEERGELEVVAADMIQQRRLIVTGSLPLDQVAVWVNAADAAVVGSHHEGWSTAMVEALACGKPIVSTNISGAAELIRDGVNGYVLTERSAPLMANAMLRACELPQAAKTSLALARRFALSSLKEDLQNVWLRHSK